MPLAPKLVAAGNTHTKTFPPTPIRPRCYQQGHDECGERERPGNAGMAAE